MYFNKRPRKANSKKLKQPKMPEERQRVVRFAPDDSPIKLNEETNEPDEDPNDPRVFFKRYHEEN